MAKSRAPLTFEHEDALSALVSGPVAGVDEVGRGPWAGPVVACAVIADRTAVPDGLDDSKKLTPKRREALSALVLARHEVSIGRCSVPEIDEVGVGRATMIAMTRAIAGLRVRPAAVIVDGTQLPELPDGMVAKALPKADAISPTVAAASIVAKVDRDAEMARLDALFPGYDWASNKGYGTASHAAGLAAHGVTVHHRRSFAPIAKMIANTPS